MYAISIWLCTLTAWLGDHPHQRIEAFRTQSVCLEFCNKAVQFYEEEGFSDIQCDCERRAVNDRLID